MPDRLGVGVLRRFLFVVIAVLGTAVTVVPVAVASGPTFDDPLGAAHLLALVNADRAAAGVPPLQLRADVTTLALEHSRRMAEAGDIAHNDTYFTAETKSRLDARSLGENVAMNRSMDDAHRRLLASPGHRANLLNPAFTIVGLAVVRDLGGIGYLTQAFVEPRVATATPGPVTPVPPPTPAPPAEPPPAPVPEPAPAPEVVAPPPVPAPAPMTSPRPRPMAGSAPAAVEPAPPSAEVVPLPTAVATAPPPEPAAPSAPALTPPRQPGELAAATIAVRAPASRPRSLPVVAVLTALTALLLDLTLLRRHRRRNTRAGAPTSPPATRMDG